MKFPVSLPWALGGEAEIKESVFFFMFHLPVLWMWKEKPVATAKHPTVVLSRKCDSSTPSPNLHALHISEFKNNVWSF